MKKIPFLLDLLFQLLLFRHGKLTLFSILSVFKF